MPLALQIAPALEPITVAEAKLNCRVDHAVDDTLFADVIKAMRERAEHETGRALITQTWDLLLDAFPCAEIELGKPKVLSIVSVTYLDPAGVSQTIDSANYTLDSASLPGWVLPAVGYEWPATQQAANAVRVRFTAGYGPASTDVPAAIRQWIQAQVAAAYRNREAFVAGFTAVSELPNRFVDGLLDPYRTYL